jgi:hypothetical protein
MILIVPMAGRSSRFPNMKPKWMLTHPSGRFMVIEAIKGLNLTDFNKIIFVCLEEHEALHGFTKGFNEELEALGLLEKSSILYLKETTKHQSETVAKAIASYDIKEAIFVKDSDNFFTATYTGNNTVCFSDLNSSGLIKPKNKSYISVDENGIINNIVEKQVISSSFCVGGYGFESAEEFMRHLNNIQSDNEVYLSNVIFEMILNDKPFKSTPVENYKDWGTLEDWDRFKRSYATLFLDIDGTLVKNSSSHFPPYIGNTPALDENVDIIKKLYATGKFQIILTTSRPEKYRPDTLAQLKKEQIPFDHLIMGLYHAKRIIINDYSKSNPYKSCDAINLKRDSQDLKEILRESLGIDYEEI